MGEVKSNKKVPNLPKSRVLKEGIFIKMKRESKSKILIYTLILVFLGYWVSVQNIDVTYRVKLKPNKNDKSYVEEYLLLSIRGDKLIYYSVAYQYMMGNQVEAAQKGLDIVLKNNNSIAIFSNRRLL